ncbi:glutamine--fructose-6-phosphate transaminase (isomerizing) [Salinisphaera sp. Q1T1-3]|uniref:glutamine--fructose-6-phosphate transaminase (isomerizing) n=1 Tax=Salinisphaera sp. Q1T1-3 TaxID=2321229 RepID=UPI000E714E9F|nr:glutamine--fructose-6-phosphate transaminase (isomerizing) [Salinisphaera sp. Q1T1-3]RJS93339.1 glutamine--fructose-6-phosphate transaminase (isomerizing) [Salinisphaera sp. Q1T1-3]
MCGIVGASAQRDVSAILLEGLRRLEYRGYDSAGMALIDDGVLTRRRAVGKVAALAEALGDGLPGRFGIAHTRWATHGGVTEANAHPHVSNGRIAVVHNGIVENHEPLRDRLIAAGYRFESETDTEVVAHLIDAYRQEDTDLTTAVRRASSALHGAYALAVVSVDDPDTVVATRRGSPLVLGVGIGEHFVASDVAALLPVTRRFVYLEEGDIVTLTPAAFEIIDGEGRIQDRPIKESALSISATEKGGYRHFMLKEIHEQPAVLAETWQGRLAESGPLASAIGPEAEALLAGVEAVHIVACGTSYHAGLVARYWIESRARLPCSVELASEYRYRDPVVPPNCLFVTLSQSGETADTLAALRYAKGREAGTGYLATLAICNKPETSLTRESDLVLMTRAGPEIGVASTKAFTTQLACLLMLAGMLSVPGEARARLAAELREIESVVSSVLELDRVVAELAEAFVDKRHALFLGRGPMYPIAMEGALKLKEISYLHAEAYAAGELKHGPLALVDDDMPVVAVAPTDEWLEKVKSNLQEVRARGGQLYVFADETAGLKSGPGFTVLRMPHVVESLAPIAYTVPLQLLAYHVAVAKGTDVDQPRNLAKSVTVE